MNAWFLLDLWYVDFNQCLGGFKSTELSKYSGTRFEIVAKCKIANGKWRRMISDQHLKWISTVTLCCKCHLLTSKSSKSSSTQKYLKPKEYSSFKDKVTFSWNPTAAKVWQSYRLEQEDTNFSGVLTFRPNTKVRQFQRHKKWNIFLDHNVCLILDVVSIHYQPLSNDLPPTAGHGQYVVHIGQMSLTYPVLRRFNNDNAKKNSWNH